MDQNPAPENRLRHESSPYLLQHAGNPVDWWPWCEEALENARSGDKLLIVSIGYAACHWCHVMERETFTDPAAAEIMNRHFINIKVDREERPDIDQIYMEALQMMTGHGGWPLNIIALPDGRPFYGGTYFPNEAWKGLLQQIAEIYRTNPSEIKNQAERVVRGLKTDDFPERESPDVYGLDDIRQAVERWKPQFDLRDGGTRGAPKFPMPQHGLFLLRYATHFKDDSIRDFVLLTLDRMAAGGMYDQLGGGFARYSTDPYWKVPHFEKMLYDNAQLIHLYSEAWQLTGREEYRNVVMDTFRFIQKEMTSPEGAFYSALDADSEGVEGKYYTWTEEEIDALLGPDAEAFKAYYGVGVEGYWEEGRNILLRPGIDTLDRRQALTPESLARCRETLLTARQHRVRPATDDKVLTSWNALMASALLQSWQILREDALLEAGRRNLDFILDRLTTSGNRLFHRYRDGKAGIPGFLEDYAFLAEALLAFPAWVDEKYHWTARELAETVIRDFHDPETSLFFFTAKENTALGIRKREIQDQVIPSSNAIMARSLHRLGILFSDPRLLRLSERMVAAMQAAVVNHLPAFTCWGIHLMETYGHFRTLAVIGPGAARMANQLKSRYLPGLYIVGTKGESRLPLFQHRYREGKTLLYLCSDRACMPPAETAEEILGLLS